MSEVPKTKYYMGEIDCRIQMAVEKERERIRAEIQKHSYFLKNCRAQRKKPAKICMDCPFIHSGILKGDD